MARDAKWRRYGDFPVIGHSLVIASLSSQISPIAEIGAIKIILCEPARTCTGYPVSRNSMDWDAAAAPPRMRPVIQTPKTVAMYGRHSKRSCET